jgi:hypothetical protein
VAGIRDVRARGEGAAHDCEANHDRSQMYRFPDGLFAGNLPFLMSGAH